MKSISLSKLLTDYLSEFLPYRAELSSNTISSYCDAFKLLLRFCRDNLKMSIEKISLTDIDDTLVYSFLNWLEKERNCSNSTINQRLHAIHSFVRYAQCESPENLLTFKKVLNIPARRQTQPIVSYINENDMRKVLQNPDTSNIFGRRDLTLLSVMYDTGARVSEIVNLTVRDVRLETPAKIKLFGKGRKYRDVPILPRTVAMLESYLKEHRLITADKLDYPLFFNRKRQKFTRAGVAYILSKNSSQLTTMNNTHITPHVLRHTKAMHLLQAGVSIIYIKDILGHVDISTTEVYARADLEMKRKALEKLSEISPSTPPEWNTNTDLLTWLENFGKRKL